MSVDIPADMLPFVQSMIVSGGFRSETEVVGEALRLMQERQRRLEELRAEIQPSLERLDRGECIELDQEGLNAFFEDIKTRGRARQESRRDLQ